MSHEVLWTPEIVERFIRLAGFDQLENQRFADIMRFRARNIPITYVCDRLHISKSTYDRNIAHCKRMYDLVQEMHPDLLPVRLKKSVKY